MFMHFSCIHSFLIYSVHVFPSVLSLSLSRIDCVMAPKQYKSILAKNPYMVLGYLLLLFLPYLLIFSSMMRRLRQTSLRTSRFVAFIRNARSFCQFFSTLCYPMSFGLGDGNLSVRNPCIVLSCLFKSFTPTYTAPIPLCLSLLLHSKVHVLQLLQVLCIPRVVHLDYPSCDRLRTVSRDELISHFCGTPFCLGW